MNAIGIKSNDWDKHFRLMEDIDLVAYTGTDFNIIGIDKGNPFSGVFDGNGHIISNFSYTSTDGESVGLFGYVEGEDAEIKDLGLIDPNVDGRTGGYVGSLVGRNGGTITNCYAEGVNVAGNDRIGGYNVAVGGLVGKNSGSIANSYATGDVSGNEDVGGMVGESEWGTINNCYAAGSVLGGNRVGGLVGHNWDGMITDSYATGGVSGDDRVGGLVGSNDSWWGLEMIANCYSVGAVTGTTDVGGLVGSNNGGVSVSFWDIETSGQSTSSGGMGKTTDEMQDPNTFMEAGWDFAPHDIWVEAAGGGYPVLWWQLSPLPELPAFSGGAGEPENPYLLSTAEDLNRIGNNPRLMGAHFRLTNDIDLAGVDFFIIGSRLFPFDGVFDGNRKRIFNFSQTSTNTAYTGLFGYIEGENAEIRDLGLIDPNVEALGESTIRPRRRGIRQPRGVGSLVGDISAGAITNCYVEGGSVEGGSVLAFGDSCPVGGLVGSNGGTVTNCYSTGSVSGDSVVGGLVGSNGGTVTNCYSTGSVSGDGCVGGLVGGNDAGNIITSYSTGTVSGIDDVGGLAGTGGGVLYCVWDMETSGLSGSAGGMGLTTVEMMDPYMLGLNGFANDLNWVLNPGKDYPRLAWEGTAGEPIPQSVIDWMDGDGTPEMPYQITNVDQLILLSKASVLADGCFILINDLDLEGLSWFQAVIPSFSGSFDGNGFCIRNLSVQGGAYLGFIGILRGGVVTNLGFENISVEGTGFYFGGVVGLNDDGSVNDCYSSGTVNGDCYVGGLVGQNEGSITASYSTSAVSGGEYCVGGLVGSNYYGTIATSYSTGTVSGEDYYVGGLVGHNRGSITTSYSTGTVSGIDDVGGLVGYNQDDNITNCYTTGNVSGLDDVGGLVGRNDGDITTSYSTGTVSGVEDVGGLAGENKWGTITNCYAAGSVEGYEGVGGLVGWNNRGGTIINCCATGGSSGTGYVGGLVEQNYQGEIINCYSTGSALGDDRVGGLVGHNLSGTITSSFWDIQTSGLSNMCGIQEDNATGCDDSYGKTTTEMQTASTFQGVGWDFVDETANGTEDIWWIDEGNDYPRLWWEAGGN
jgi:hypothetical protein